MFPYVGNGAYCYANSISMLLAAHGETISPSLIEPLTGVGLGALWDENATELFFSNLATPPDIGLSQALNLLGFDFIERVSENPTSPPWETLRADLQKSPAILGPVDMGFLRYNSLSKYVQGADHYILVYKLDEKEAFLHDPDGFPHVSLPLNFLEQAWKADAIGYRRGSYRYWTGILRREQPTPDEIFARAIQAFRSSYHESAAISAQTGLLCNETAILACTERLRPGKVPGPLKSILKLFALKLGARRALDFATFFDLRSPDLAQLKRQQAQLFGQSHTLAVAERWTALSKNLQTLAELEKEFRTALTNCA